MKSIDHFTIAYNNGDGVLLNVTFTRIGNFLGWHAEFQDKPEEKFGDWITLVDDKITPEGLSHIDTGEAVKEGCEILADQAAYNLSKLKESLNEENLVAFLRAHINERVWK